MSRANDPELIDAMQRIFMTRDEARSLVEYQQRLFNALQDLTNNHRAVHEHVRKLTDSHNRVQDSTNELVRTRGDLSQLLRGLDDSHRQTRDEIRRAIDAINMMQNEMRKVQALEDRLRRVEQEIQKIWQDDKADDRKFRDQDQRLDKVEHQQKKHFL